MKVTEGEYELIYGNSSEAKNLKIAKVKTL